MADAKRKIPRVCCTQPQDLSSLLDYWPTKLASSVPGDIAALGFPEDGVNLLNRVH